MGDPSVPATGSIAEVWVDCQGFWELRFEGRVLASGRESSFELADEAARHMRELALLLRLQSTVPDGDFGEF